MRRVAFTLLLAPLIAAASNEVVIYRCTDAHGHETYQDARCPINSFEHVIRMQRPQDAPVRAAPVTPEPPPAPQRADGGTGSEPGSPPAATPEPATEPVKFSLPPWETQAADEAVAPPPRGYSLPPWETETGDDRAETKPSEPDSDAATRARERGFSLPPWETEAGLAPRADADETPAIKLRPVPRTSPPPLWRCRGLDRKAYISATASPPPKCILLSELGIDVSALPQSQRDGCRDVHDACDRLDDAAACEHFAQLRLEAKAAVGDLPALVAPELHAELSRLDEIWKRSCSLE